MSCDNCIPAADALALFISQCGMMAEENWCKTQVEMLHRLFSAVLIGEEYSSEKLDKYLEDKKNESI